MSRLTREQLEEECRELGRSLAAALEAEAPGTGFCLLLFDFGADGNLAYMCNAERGDMRRTLDEFRKKVLCEG